jgi:hypothetical protein
MLMKIFYINIYIYIYIYMCVCITFLRLLCVDLLPDHINTPLVANGYIRSSANGQEKKKDSE